MKVTEGKKIYFASDNHLGIPDTKSSLIREKKFVKWLDLIKADAHSIYLLGDLFDFWFEYKTVVPKGFTRVLGKIAEIADSGIPIYFFTGNHDMWVRDYFQSELGVKVISKPQQFKINEKNFFIGHGDGLGPGDTSYKLMKKFVTGNRFFMWCFRLIHPDIGIKLGQFLSKEKKLMSAKKDIGDVENQWLTQYCRKKLETSQYDYFIFGHSHIPLEVELSAESKYINLGDWITNFTYAEFDGENLFLKKFD
ncbi:MAG: UDP-2,3-diacylglucosamine hydrolase [Flavobacteriaceae bacterium]|nr:UDP-2,3-diacylglucosamine hydrolase [Flavobacteriaceae bacterium]